MRVSNMIGKAGNPVRNQFVIVHGGKEYFQSYSTIIAMKEYTQNGLQITLDEKAWDCSVTTGKYRNIFLNETKKETERKIKNSIYKLANLNRINP